jgi:putative ABC transport system permease protein
VGSLLQDLKYGFRALLRQRGLTAVAVLSLGLAIGATATVFTWLNGMVLNPLPAIPDWHRVVVAHTRAPEGGTWSVSWQDFRDWRDGLRSADLAAWDMMPVGLRDGSGPTERAWSMLVSGNYFEELQVRPAFGRVLRLDDETRHAPVAVLGYRYWQRRFAGDSAVIGRTITLNGTGFTIVGVAARRFVGNYVGMDLHLYVPLTALPLLTPGGAAQLADRAQRNFEVIGRLAPGATVAQATAELEPLARRAGAAGGLAQPLGAVVRAHRDIDAPGAMRPLLGALLGVAGLVLLVACANVAGLLLARAVARRREIAVRLAVGASRGRLVRQLLTESVVLAAFAGAFGLLLTFWSRDALLALLPAVPYPVFMDFELNGWVVAFATLVTAGAAIAFGLAPALQASRPELVPALKDEIGGGGRGGRLLGSLVVAQVALSLVTLVAAGLFMRSLAQVRSIDTGMAGLDRVLLVSTDLRLSGLRGDSLHVTMARNLLERTRALPGVATAAIARSVPLGPAGLPAAETRIDGYAPRPDEIVQVAHNDVTDGYFAATGIRLLAGRLIEAADVSGNAPVAVVNEAFVRRYLAGRTAVGATLSQQGQTLRIVGVVATTKVADYTEQPVPVVYRPYSARFAPAAFSLHVRTAGPPLELVPAVRGAFAEVSAELPFLDPRSMADFTTIPYWPQLVGATMLTGIGALALLLSAVGIYGIMAYTVSRRTREIGVRVALGATRRAVLALVLRRAVRLAGLGLAVGLAGAFGVGRLLGSMLYGVSGSDPLTFAVIAALLGTVALLASWVPARRAARVDPMIALRSE